jgi:prolyl-tRNA editing enzyme YbaK/EbsC (Cys-tRNA(Pro) deacylase)
VILHPTAQRVADRLREAGLDVSVQELPASTRTAVEAADAVGCDVGQIVKSLVFVADGEPLLCLCAGDRRVDTATLGQSVRQASAQEVRAATGFAIGGVPPLGHSASLRTVVDESLTRFETVWCAGGTPRAVFEVRLDDLVAAVPGADVRGISS